MGGHEDTFRTLEAELRLVEQAFRDLSAEQWRTPTKLLPVDEAQTLWTLFDLTDALMRFSGRPSCGTKGSDASPQPGDRTPQAATTWPGCGRAPMALPGCRPARPLGWWPISSSMTWAGMPASSTQVEKVWRKSWAPWRSTASNKGC
jgi:hypothetical protein